MKRSLSLALAFCLASVTLAQSSPLPAAPPLVDIRSFIVFRDRAFQIGAPILVAGPSVANPLWSPTGQFLLYETIQGESNVFMAQEDIKEQRSTQRDRTLCVYSLSSGKSSELIRFTPQQHFDASWFAGTNRALVAIQELVLNPSSGRPEHKGALYMLDASGGVIKDFSPWSGDGKLAYTLVAPSPSQPYAFLDVRVDHSGFTSDGKPSVTSRAQTILVNANGNSTPIQIPDDSGAMAVWSPDGAKAYAMVSSPEGKGKRDWFSVSLTDGSLTPIGRPTSFYMGQERVGVISVRQVNQSTSNGKATHSLSALWLETLDPDSQNRQLLAGDAMNGAVNQTTDCASYISQGSLFVRPITEISKKRYEAAVAEWNRYQLMQQARQSGIALIMYAADYDDVLPNARQNLLSILEPYMRDSSLLGGFIYTYPGGPITAIDNPATTEIGHVNAADGRAVVYADGHVEWKPKP